MDNVLKELLSGAKPASENMKQADWLSQGLTPEQIKAEMAKPCQCEKPEPYNPQGIVAPIMPIGHCQVCRRKVY